MDIQENNSQLNHNKKDYPTPSPAQQDYETYCQQQLDEMLDDMDGRCFGDMAEGHFVRSH